MTLRNITFMTFTASDNSNLFSSYLKLKYEVFIEEMRWNKIPHSKANRITLPDRYDYKSKFCGAVDQLDGVVGVVRGTLPERFADMYRVELYSNFIALDFVQALESKVATINTLAIIRKYRYSVLSRDSLNKPILPISDRLMKCMIFELKSLGAEAILLSAIRGPASSLMKRLGFVTINPPYFLRASDYSTEEDSPSLGVLDMAIIIKDFYHEQDTFIEPHDKSEFEQAITRLRKYLNRLSGNSVCER
jgi:hypothetical protein